MKRVLSYLVYWIWSLTWGCVATILGLLMALGMLVTGHRPYRFGPNIYFKIGEQWGGFSLGPVFIMSKTSSVILKYHEAGHGLQNLIWGPLMIFVIVIPSVTRYWYREYISYKNPKRYRELPSYDSIWFEGQATRWGQKIYLDA